MKKIAAWVLVLLFAAVVVSILARRAGSPMAARDDAARADKAIPAELAAPAFANNWASPKPAAVPEAVLAGAVSAPSRAQAKTIDSDNDSAAGYGGTVAGGGTGAVTGFVPAPIDRARNGRKVVRNAELVLAANDTGVAVRRLTRIAPGYHGYVAGVSSSKDGDLMSYVLTLKVPSDAFERALEEAKAAALRVDAESVSTQDVTDQYVDLDARSRALNGTEKELLALLSESRSRGSKVRDIMEVFGELTSIRTQIEQIQGQLRQMEQITAFSTLTITVRPDALSRPVVTASWRPSETFHADLAALAGIGRSLVDLGIGVLVLGLPTALALLFVAWALVRMYRMARRLSGASIDAA